MSKKRKVAAKKPTKSAAARTPATRAKPPQPKQPAPRPARSPAGATGGVPEGNSRGTVATFEAAKSAMVDALIRSIEQAERQLSDAKRAQSFDELPRVSGEPAASADV